MSESFESSQEDSEDSPEDGVKDYSMKGLASLDRRNDETHLAGGNDKIRLAKGDSLGRASVGLLVPVAESLNPQIDNIQPAERKSIPASTSA